MQYSPKLKKAMAEIKKVLDEYDIAGSIVIHTPGFSEYLDHLTPSYSCAKMEPNGTLRIRAKKEDYHGDVKLRDEKIRDTSNMLHHMSVEVRRSAEVYERISDHLDRIVNAEHLGPGNQTSHNQQNN